MKRFILSWAILITIMVGILYIVNGRLFRPKTTTSEVAMEQQEFPLQLVTVDLKLDSLKSIFSNSELEVQRSISSIKLKPANGNNAEQFLKLVDKNNYAQRLEQLYGSDLFKLDNDSFTIKIEKDEIEGIKYVRIPTWILYDVLNKKNLK